MLNAMCYEEGLAEKVTIKQTERREPCRYLGKKGLPDGDTTANARPTKVHEKVLSITSH